MTISQFLLLITAGLVGYRISRFFTTDSLFEGTRDRVVTWGHDTTLVLGEEERVYRWVVIGGKQRKGLTVLRGKFVDGLICPYCEGFWWTLAAWFVLVDVAPWDATLVQWATGIAAWGVQSLLWSAIEDDETIIRSR